MSTLFLALLSSLALRASSEGVRTAEPTVVIRPWGANAIRVQICAGACDDALPGALGPSAPASVAQEAPQPDKERQQSEGRGSATTTSGNLACSRGSDGVLSFSRVDDGKLLLRSSGATVMPAAATGGSICLDFSSSASVLYGMGQNRPAQDSPNQVVAEYDTRSLDVRSQTFDFQQIMGNEGGATNAAPYVIGGGNAGGFAFGLLFNSPSFGGMNFTETEVTLFTARDAAGGGNTTIRKQLDFLVTTSAKGAKPAERAFSIQEAYTAAVGRTPTMPAYGSLYWHCKNRYSNQTQLLTAARYLHKNVPGQVGVLVIDWFHWKVMGDWSFDPEFWPDPAAMVEECKSYGIEIMASVWPFTCETARSYSTSVSNGFIATDSHGKGLTAGFGGKNCRLVDPTNELMRDYTWSLLQESYHKIGIKVFWLDNSEPWRPPPDAYFGQPGVAGSSGWSWADAGALFDVQWPKLFQDGLAKSGDNETGMLLPRAGWIGQWKHGTSLWNGDIGSTFGVLATSLKTMISAQLTGFGWMTVDGGGYCGGDSQSPEYRETQLRWMQLTTTLPIMRQHGQRDHTIFSWYGDANEQRLIKLVNLRKELNTYIVAELAKLSKTGRPLNRPLNYDFPQDPVTWDLAEMGVGEQNDAPAAGRAPRGGDVLRAMPCAEAPAMELTQDGQLTLKSDHTLCVDTHTAGESCNWQRQCLAGWWPCETARAHTWHRGKLANGSTDNTLRNFRDCYSDDGTDCYQSANGGAPSGAELCLQLAAPTGPLTAVPAGYFPHTLASCSRSTDDREQWVFTADGKLQNPKASWHEDLCLGAVPPPTVEGIDQYMVGDAMMAAPVLVAGARSRSVYFPIGASYRHHFTNETFKGGTTVEVAAPLDHFPLFHVSRE